MQIETQYESKGVLDDPYSKLIDEFFAKDFPGQNIQSKDSLLEVLTSIFVSTSNVRFGPIPNPESLVAIRNVIRLYIERQLPIPILVPWGGRKTVLNRSIDIAEITALKQLNCLYNKIKEQYNPGIEINIRIEDVNALYLYQDDMIEGTNATEKYSDEFRRLVRILNLHFIHPIRERVLMNKEEYFKVANEIQEVMFDYLVELESVGHYPDSKSWIKLQELGWQGRIPKEQRDYYYQRYQSLHSAMTPYKTTKKLSEYFAGSLARYKLSGTGAANDWMNDYIKIIFVPPVPGAPVTLTNKSLYYRTAPEKLSRNHIAPWRAKGFLRIDGSNVTPKILGFKDNIRLTEHFTKLSRAGDEVLVQTDYNLKEE